MQLPAFEVDLVAAALEASEARLVDVLRREGIQLTENLGGAWPPPAPAPDAVVLWFPGTPIPERALDLFAMWLDQQVSRPGALAVAAAADAEALLSAGLDDAVPRTISDRELVARIRALHRRMTRRPREGHLRFGAITVDTVERSAWMDGTIVSITPIEQAVLVTLIRAGGRALSRLALLDSAWGDSDLEISERAVDNVILRLRRKLPRPEVIETVRGVGFRLATAGADAPRRADARRRSRPTAAPESKALSPDGQDGDDGQDGEDDEGGGAYAERLAVAAPSR
jgi:DNA-binding winged helix-turn-helix (wHTH) protein